MTLLALGNSYRLLRRNLEGIAVGAMIGVLFWKKSEITTNFSNGSWSLEGFYGAVFNWSSIQAGFLFGAYAFFLSRSEPFIQAVAASAPFMELRTYVRRTLYLTLILAAASVPMLIAPPKMNKDAYLHSGFIIFGAFSIVLTYTIFCMLKVVRVFGKLERPR